MSQNILKRNLHRIQTALSSLHNLAITYPIEEFVAPPRSNTRGETTIESHEDGTYSLAVHLGPAIIDKLGERDIDLRKGQLDAVAVAVEEISHFTHLAQAVETGRSLRIVELELHGELDKFFVMTKFAHEQYDHPHFDTFLHALFDRSGIIADDAECYVLAEKMAYKFIKNLISDPARRFWLNDAETEMLRRYIGSNWQDKYNHHHQAKPKKAA
jgi:hypothetical protein